MLFRSRHKSDAVAQNLRPSERINSDGNGFTSATQVFVDHPSPRLDRGQVVQSRALELGFDSILDVPSPDRAPGNRRRGDPQSREYYIARVDEHSSAAGDFPVAPKAEQVPAFLIARHHVTSRPIERRSTDCAFLQGDPASQTLHFAKQACMLGAVPADVYG